MALPSSGEISLLALQNEYGGSSPISISEYYRNGAYVPNSIGGTVREPSSGDYFQNTNPLYIWNRYVSSGTNGLVFWNDQIIEVPADSSTSYTTGGYTYYLGTYRYTDPGSKFFPAAYVYGIYRTYGSSILVNQNVPTSGTISLSNFYGGRKT